MTAAAGGGNGQAPAAGTTTETPQAGANANSNNPPPTTPQAGAETTPGTGQQPPAGMTAEEAARVIAELRRENAKHRTDLKKFEDAQLTEQQRLEKRATDAEATAKAYQQRIAGYEVKITAQKLGIIDPDLALLAIQSQLEYEDDGTPKNAEKLLADLAKAKPYLVAANANGSQTQAGQPAGQRPTSSSGGATNPGAAGGIQGQGVIFTRDQINRMSPAEYERNKAAIYDQMAKNLIR